MEPSLARQEKIEKSTRYAIILLLALAGFGCVFYPILLYPDYLSSGSSSGVLADLPLFRLGVGTVINAIGLYGSLRILRGLRARIGPTRGTTSNLSSLGTKVSNQQCKPCKDGSMPVQVELPTLIGKSGDTTLTITGLKTWGCPNDEKRLRLPSDNFQIDLFREMLVNGGLPVTTPYVGEQLSGDGSSYYVWPDRLYCSSCNSQIPGTGKSLALTHRNVVKIGEVETTIRLPDVPPFHLTYEGETITCPSCGTIMVFDYFDSHKNIREAQKSALRKAGMRLGARRIFEGLFD